MALLSLSAWETWPMSALGGSLGNVGVGNRETPRPSGFLVGFPVDSLLPIRRGRSP